VKRINLATSLYRAAMTGLLNAAKEVRELPLVADRRATGFEVAG
jgi:hypothetical protein